MGYCKYLTGGFGDACISCLCSQSVGWISQ